MKRLSGSQWAVVVPGSETAVGQQTMSDEIFDMYRQNQSKLLLRLLLFSWNFAKLVLKDKIVNSFCNTLKMRHVSWALWPV